MGKLKIILKLDRILAAKGMSGRELSRRTEDTGNFVRHRTIHEMMNGTTKHLVIANLVSICEVLGCGLDDIMELQPAEEGPWACKEGELVAKWSTREEVAERFNFKKPAREGSE